MNLEKKSLLVIDDDHEICELLKFRFEKLGFVVRVAHRGEDGYDLVMKSVPDCILLDIRIEGGEDGLSFLRRIRSFRDDDMAKQKAVRAVPVVVMTAMGHEMKALFEPEGISDFIEKPYDPATLKESVFRASGAKLSSSS